jgi:hypothetical protein
LRWAKRLELDQNFTLIDESIYRNNSIKEISNDKIEINDEEREMFPIPKNTGGNWNEYGCRDVYGRSTTVF